MNHLLCFAVGILFLLLPPFGTATFGTTTCHSQETDSRLEQIFHDYHQQYLILFPLEATAFGDGRYNDLLPVDISPEFIAKERQFYQSTLAALQGVDRTQASDTLQLAAEVLQYELEMRIEGLKYDFDRIPFHQFDGLPLLFAQLGSGSSSQPFQSLRDYENWLKRMEAFPSWSQAAIARFRQGMKEQYVLPKILVERMVGQLLDPTIVADKASDSLFYGPLQKFPTSISADDQTRLTVAYQRAIESQVIPAYRQMGEFLRDEYLPEARTSTGISALPDGEQHYRFWVRRWTTTDLEPEAIFDLGQREVARIREAMILVQQQMKHEGTLLEFFEFLRTDPQFKPFTKPEEVVAFFASLQATVEPRLDKIFLNKPKTPFEIRRTESFREKTASAEYMPGSADGSRPGIFYAPIPNAMEYNITGGMESLFLHEALPGHHYQVSLQQENQSLPEFARFLWYGAYGEGWALYCESMGPELGLYTDPKQRIGALGDEMHRAIRLVVDVGMHAKGWTRKQAIEYMMANEPVDYDGAVAEIERYMAFTAQALSYKIGQLEILKLRRNSEARLSDRFSLARFHDEVLRNGCMPLSVLKRRLENWELSELAKDN